MIRIGHQNASSSGLTVFPFFESGSHVFVRPFWCRKRKDGRVSLVMIGKDGDKLSMVYCTVYAERRWSRDLPRFVCLDGVTGNS